MKKYLFLVLLAALQGCSRSDSVPTAPTPVASATEALDEDAVPRYPGAKVIFSMGTEDGITIGLETPDAREKVVAFYQDHFKGRPRLTVTENAKGLLFVQMSSITSGPSATVLVKPAKDGVTTVALYSRR